MQTGIANGLAELIIKLVINPVFSKNMSAAGMHQVENHFSLQKTITALEYVIFECVSNMSSL